MSTDGRSPRAPLAHLVALLSEHPAAAAIVGGDGRLVAVHDLRDGSRCGALSSRAGSVDLLAALEGTGQSDAVEAAQGLRSVLLGHAPVYALEMPRGPGSTPLAVIARSLGENADGLTLLRAANPPDGPAEARTEAPPLPIATERSARLILASVPMVVYTAEPRAPYHTLWVSENIEQVSGFPRGMFLDQPGLFASRVHPDDVPALHGVEQALRETGGAASEYRWQRRDGSWRWFLDKCSLSLAEGGRPLVTGTWLDITDRKSAEIALQESERRLALVLDATREGVWDWRIDTGEVHFSTAWTCSLGYEPEEVPPTVEFWQSVVHPDDMPRVEKALSAHFAGETPYYTCENRLRMKSGQWRWNLDRGRIVEWDAEGRPVRMVGTDTDITERRQAEEALRASEQRLELAVETAGIGTWDWDLASGHVHYSDRWKSMLGREPDAIGPTFDAWSELLHPDDRARVIAHAEDYLAGRIPRYHTEFRMQHADGGWVWIESRARITARDELGRPTRLTGVHLDITERRRADEELVLSRERALRAEHLAALGTLAAGTAHELNSPLGAILLAASYGLEIAADADPEALTECLRDIERQARRGRDVVESVLLFAADERADRRPTSLADVVEEAVRAVAPDAAAHGATIEVLPHEPLPDMLVNRMNVSRAFVNLLKNAVESGEGVAVTVRLGRGDGTVRVAVSDTGRGISAEAAGRIFDPFYTTRRERGGTGLGLSITHGIVRRHGGTIRVESAPGAGTTFTVELPLSAANSVGARGGWRRSW